MKEHLAPDPLAGFDLGPVLAWLTANRERVAEKLSWLDAADGVMMMPIEGSTSIQLSPEEIVETINRFPYESLRRSVLNRIQRMPVTWFAKGSTVGKPLVTTDVSEALSPTTIVPGSVSVDAWTDIDKRTTIYLYRIPGVDRAIAKYMLVHALMHEYAHTLLYPMLYTGDRPYILESPEHVRYQDSSLLRLFAKEVAEHPAISHYAALYRPIPTDPEHPDFIARASEEFCESVAAYLLGYIYCDNPERCWDPFGDRPFIKHFIRNFLEGSQVS